jgi:hypothetical protein
VKFLPGFLGGFSFNIEAYHKKIFNRTYSIADSAENGGTQYFFDGEGRILGFDLMLQKAEGHYFDGWLSYSFTWAQYKEPESWSWRKEWYYPNFHRYNYLNLVLNIKPTEKFNMNFRFGFASGKPERTSAGSRKQTTERTGFSWPIDMKFSFIPRNRGKIKTEIYVAVENLQSLFYTAEWVERTQNYTGQEATSEYEPVYEMPFPMVSFGFKFTGL